MAEIQWFFFARTHVARLWVYAEWIETLKTSPWSIGSEYADVFEIAMSMYVHLDFTNRNLICGFQFHLKSNRRSHYNYIITPAVKILTFLRPMLTALHISDKMREKNISSLWIQRFRFQHWTFGQIVDDFSFYHKNEFKPISRIEKCKCDDGIRIVKRETGSFD